MSDCTRDYKKLAMNIAADLFTETAFSASV